MAVEHAPSERRGAASPARIIIVDDHPIVRLGIRQMLSADAGLSVCGEADSAEAALQLAKRSEADSSSAGPSSHWI